MCSNGTGSKLSENINLTRAIWKRFLNGTLGDVGWTQNLVLFRPVLVPNLPYLKTVTLTAFLVTFFALFKTVWGLSELLLIGQQILTVSSEHTRLGVRASVWNAVEYNSIQFKQQKSLIARVTSNV